MQYRVCHVQEIPRGEKRNYTVKNVQVVVVHSQQGEFYAIYGLCPHQRGPLGAGVLGGLTKAAQAGESPYSPSYLLLLRLFCYPGRLPTALMLTMQPTRSTLLQEVGQLGLLII